MDKVKLYEDIILKLLNPLNNAKFHNIDGKSMLITDKETHNYLVVLVGFENSKNIYNCLVHVTIQDGKIWFQRNQTDYDFGNDLRDFGVPKSDIVIGFLAPEMREYSDYAVA
jgi:XisI protein